jgi:bifunctional ADP-heptose synthase (sugar kinase/adenylyltransferase)
LDFKELEAKFQSLSVLVYGDHYLDRNSIGKWQGFSREEEELPIFHMTQEMYNPGGAGNLAANFAALGVKTTVAGIWGGVHDWNRKILEEEFLGRRINPIGMVEGGRTPKFEKSYFKSGVHVYRADLDPEELSPKVKQACCSELQTLLAEANFDFLVVADYDETGNGVCFPRALEILSTCSKSKFGTSRTRISRFRVFDTLVLNRKELIQQVGDEEMTLNLRAAFLASITGANAIVVTLSGQGARFYQRRQGETSFMSDNPFECVEVPAVPVSGRIDPCGCGDTFFALLVSTLFTGYDIKESMQVANSGARVIVKKKYGAATPTWSEIATEYQTMYTGEK